MTDCMDCRPRIIRLREGEEFMSKFTARQKFWSAVCGVRPECIEALKTDVLPSYAASSMVNEDADFPDCLALRNKDKFTDQAFLDALQCWQRRWVLTMDWIVPHVDDTLDDLARGRYKKPTLKPNKSSPPVPCEMGIGNPKCLLNMIAKAKNEEKERHRNQAPEELALRFEEWWYLPSGETRDEARDRISDRFQEELSAYLLRVQEFYAPELRKFYYKHFLWLAQRIVPDRSGHRARVMDIDHDRSEVSRKTIRLAGFIGLDIPPVPRGKSTITP
jgi:hypothetical protein